MRWRSGKQAVLLGFGLVAWAMLYGLAAAPAYAHFSAIHGGGWSDGFAHPFSGIDHVTAMTALGLWAAVNGRRAQWLLPAAFAVAMALGAGMALAGLTLPGAEDGIALSVVFLGVLLAVAARPQLWVGAALAGGFGLVHGYAHGAEMPDAATPALYALGFLSATALLLLSGLALGLAARSPLGQRLLPVGAAALTGIGIALMLAL